MHIMNAGEGERHWDDGFYKISFRGVVEEPIKKAIPQPLYDGNKGRVFWARTFSCETLAKDEEQE